MSLPLRSPSKEPFDEGGVGHLACYSRQAGLFGQALERARREVHKVTGQLQDLSSSPAGPQIDAGGVWQLEEEVGLRPSARRQFCKGSERIGHVLEGVDGGH